jgi:hypothetical protein
MRLSEVPKVQQPEWLKKLSDKDLAQINEKLFKGMK